MIIQAEIKVRQEAGKAGLNMGPEAFHIGLPHGVQGPGGLIQLHVPGAQIQTSDSTISER